MGARISGVQATLRTARHGLMGHLYPGMLDVSTDLTTVSTTIGSHVEVLELDVRARTVTTFGVGQDPDGRFVFVTSEGEVVPGQLTEVFNLEDQLAALDAAPTGSSSS